MSIFVSYRLARAQLVRERILRPLEGAGLGEAVFMASEKMHLEANSQVWHSLARKVTGSQLFILAATKDVFETGNCCINELTMALDLRRQCEGRLEILVVVLEEGVEGEIRTYTSGMAALLAPEYPLLLHGNGPGGLAYQTARFVEAVCSKYFPLVDASSMSHAALSQLQKREATARGWDADLSVHLGGSIPLGVVMVPAIRATFGRKYLTTLKHPFLITKTPVWEDRSYVEIRKRIRHLGLGSVPGHSGLRPRLLFPDELRAAHLFLAGLPGPSVKFIWSAITVSQNATAVRWEDGVEYPFHKNFARPALACHIAFDIPWGSQ